MKLYIIPLLILCMFIISGCTAKREVKTAACIVKTQPSENKCLEKLAIDSKDPAPCDRIKLLTLANKTAVFPTKISCYAQVAFWSGEEGVCNQLPTEENKHECKYRYQLYLETAQEREV